MPEKETFGLKKVPIEVVETAFWQIRTLLGAISKPGEAFLFMPPSSFWKNLHQYSQPILEASINFPTWEEFKALFLESKPDKSAAIKDVEHERKHWLAVQRYEQVTGKRVSVNFGFFFEDNDEIIPLIGFPSLEEEIKDPIEHLRFLEFVLRHSERYDSDNHLFETVQEKLKSLGVAPL